jgi:TonB family protein
MSWAGWWHVLLGAGFIVGVPQASRAAEPPAVASADDGNHAAGDAPAAYLRALEGKFDKAFYDDFIRLAPYEVVGSPTAARAVDVRFVVRWDGTVASLEVVKSSGVSGFDEGALEVVRRLSPYRPPVGVLADDGLAHFMWHFGRRQEEANGKIEDVQFPLGEAIPRLVAAGRAAEAERRVREALANPNVDAGVLAVFARAVLAQPAATAAESLAIAEAHAALHEPRAANELRRWVFSVETAAEAARALTQLGADPSHDIAVALADAGAIREAGVAAALAVPETLGGCEVCVNAIAEATRPGRGRTSERRIAAVRALGGFRQGPFAKTAHEALARLTTDNDPLVRAHALLASVGPEDGRRAVFKMAALLKDPAPTVRGAAAAAILRTAGDREIDQLYGVYRERSDVAMGFIAEELGRQDGPASLDMLVKLLHKAEGRRRAMLVEALALRQDANGRAAAAPFLADARRSAEEDVGIRRLALRGASPTDVLAMASDQRLGLEGYRALLTSGMAREAAAWLLDRYDGMDSVSRLKALGLWLAPHPAESDAPAGARLTAR